jgi:hypothetical protein
MTACKKKKFTKQENKGEWWCHGSSESAFRLDGGKRRYPGRIHTKTQHNQNGHFGFLTFGFINLDGLDYEHPRRWIAPVSGFPAFWRLVDSNTFFLFPLAWKGLSLSLSLSLFDSLSPSFYLAISPSPSIVLSLSISLSLYTPHTEGRLVSESSRTAIMDGVPGVGFDHRNSKGTIFWHTALAQARCCFFRWDTFMAGVF